MFWKISWSNMDHLTLWKEMILLCLNLSRLHLDDIHTLRYYIKPTKLCLINIPQTGIMNIVWIERPFVITLFYLNNTFKTEADPKCWSRWDPAGSFTSSVMDFMVDMFWIIWATLPSPDVLNRGRKTFSWKRFKTATFINVGLQNTQFLNTLLKKMKGTRWQYIRSQCLYHADADWLWLMEMKMMNLQREFKDILKSKKLMTWTILLKYPWAHCLAKCKTGDYLFLCQKRWGETCQASTCYTITGDASAEQISISRLTALMLHSDSKMLLFCFAWKAEACFIVLTNHYGKFNSVFMYTLMMIQLMNHNTLLFPAWCSRLLIYVPSVCCWEHHGK